MGAERFDDGLHAAAAAEFEALCDGALKAYWGDALSHEPMMSRERMAAAFAVAADRLRKRKPEARLAPLVARTIDAAAWWLEGYRDKGEGEVGDAEG